MLNTGYEDPLARGVRRICEGEGVSFEGLRRQGDGFSFTAGGVVYAVPAEHCRPEDALMLEHRIRRMIADATAEQRYRDRPKPRLGMGTRGYRGRGGVRC